MILPDFLVEFVYSDEIKSIFDSINGGSTVSHLNVEDIKNLLFFKAPANEQFEIIN